MSVGERLSSRAEALRRGQAYADLKNNVQGLMANNKNIILSFDPNKNNDPSYVELAEYLKKLMDGFHLAVDGNEMGYPGLNLMEVTLTLVFDDTGMLVSGKVYTPIAESSEDSPSQSSEPQDNTFFAIKISPSDELSGVIGNEIGAAAQPTNLPFVYGLSGDSETTRFVRFENISPS